MAAPHPSVPPLTGVFRECISMTSLHRDLPRTVLPNIFARTNLTMFFRLPRILFPLVLLFCVSPALPASEPEKTLVRYERYGGFAGFHDDLTIHADFTYLLDTPSHVKHVYRGTLGEEQQTKLAALLKTFQDYTSAQDDGPNTADGMKTRLEVHGTGSSGGAEDLRGLDLFLQQLMREARSGKQTPKE
jgi:hypothetical protein